MLLLGTVLVTAALAILLGAGPVKNLVVHHRWIMYSLFIGLTLGGAPLVWRMLGRPTRSMWVGLAAGFIVMWAIAVLPLDGISSHPGRANLVMLFVAGLAGASAMILPGISGGYLLLLLGQYVPILSAIERFKGALENGDIHAAIKVGLFEGLPVAAGVLLGVVCVSNLLRVLLERYKTATLGLLLGLLLGSVVGLWPFQQGVRPEAGDLFKGQILTAETLEELKPEDYPTRFFHPAGIQIGGSVLILLAGFGVTTAIARLGREKV
jgi:putative membrane protein